MGRILWGLVVPLVMLSVGVGAFIVLGKAEPKKLPPLGTDLAARLALLPEAESESVELLASFSETLDITVSGTVVPFRQINVATEVDGKVAFKAKEARAGNFVKKGQPLYRIDPRDYELAVDRLERMLEQEQATLKELEQDVANANRMLDVNKEELALYDADLDRLQSLPAGIASRSEVDLVKRSRLTAVNQATSLHNQILSLDTRRTRLDLAKRLAANQLEQARLNLARCEIAAPVDGVIANEMAQADSYIRKGETLATVEDLGSVEVQCNLRVDQLMWILDQQAARSTGNLPATTPGNAYALPRTPVTIEFKVTGREDLIYRWQGHLDRYDGSGVDPQSRTIPCRVVVDSPTSFTVNGEMPNANRVSGLSALVRGMFVDVIIAAKPHSVLLLVPRLAVKPGNIIWKFEPDPAALPAAKTDAKSESSNTAKVERQSNSPTLPSTTSLPNAKSAIKAAPLVPEEWDVGYLRTLTQINVVQTFDAPATADTPRTADAPRTAKAKTDAKPWSAQKSATGTSAAGKASAVASVKKYWICEVPNGALQAGDRVIVSPLSGIVGDGSDGLRVRK